MANYYKIVNVSRKEVFEPSGLKRGSLLAQSASFMELLLGDWFGDNIVVIADCFDEDEDLGKLYDESEGWTNRAGAAPQVPHAQPRPPCSVTGKEHRWDTPFVGQKPVEVRVCRDCGVEEL